MMTSPAHAEVSASLSIASQYLWRGQSLSSNAALSGALDYDHRSGFYLGGWTTSLDESIEYDLYGGYRGQQGDWQYDLGYVGYFYPDASPDNMQEAYLKLGYGSFGAEAYFGVGDYGWGGNAVRNRDNYFLLRYQYQKFGVASGYYDHSAADYTHLDVSYEAYPGLVFTASQIVQQDAPKPWDNALQVMVAYTFTF